MSSAWIETYTGLKFDILDPQPDMICIEDIAHALSQANRFTGHCRFPYPVSQHCRLGSYLAPIGLEREFLMHDSEETYLGDMNKAVKYFTAIGEEYFKVAKIVKDAINCVFNLPLVESPAIKRLDDAMAYAEKAQLMTPTPWDREWDEPEERVDVAIIETSFWDNKYLFLNRFYQLEKEEARLVIR